MNISKHQSEEIELQAHASDLKARGDYPALKEYLIDAIVSGQLSARLQAVAYIKLGLVHLQLDEPMEAEKAFLSAGERDAEVASSNSEVPKKSNPDPTHHITNQRKNR